MKDMPEIIENLLNEEMYLNMVVIPLEFLAETDQFDFLFEVVKDKIIASLTVDNSSAAYDKSEAIFFRVL